MKDIEIVVFKDKSWVRLTEYQKLKAQIEEMEKEKCELLGIIQKKDNFIDKMKCCSNCKHGNEGEYDCFENCSSCTVMYCICPKTKEEMDWTDKCDNWELAE
jgi:hypothetical protein